MKSLSPVDAALLDALATYRLLTIQQAVRLGIANRYHVGERLRDLERARLVKILKRARMAGPYIHWLTARGAQVVEEIAADMGEARKVGVRKVEYRLGPHLRQREMTVDCHIALRQWAARQNARVEWVRSEFDPTEKQLGKATALEADGINYEADALASIVTANGLRWLLALEVETGGESESLENFAKRLPARLEALEKKVPEKALQWPKEATAKGARLLFIFSSVSMLERAKQMVGRPDAAIWRRVHLNALPLVMEDFGSSWWQPGGDQPFPLSAS